MGTTAAHFDPEWLDGSKFPTAALQIPSDFEIRGDHLYWAWHGFEAGASMGPFVPRYVSPDGMLDRFIGIRTSRDVIGFVRRYGVLGICEHGVPASHNTPALPGSVGGLDLGCSPLSDEVRDPRDFSSWTLFTFREPIAAWMRAVRAANAILHLATVLYEGRRLSGEERRWVWKLAWGGLVLVGGTSERLDPKEELAAEALSERQEQEEPKGLLTAVVNWWLYVGHAGVTLEWPSDFETPTLKLAGVMPPYVPATFGVLAGQLMLAVTGARAMPICSGCGRPYVRKKRYQPKRFKGVNYCPTCNEKGIPNKLRMQRKRAKALGKHRLRQPS